jgi:hypothetical protein
MAVYTVHEPPPATDGASSELERFVFVRDGFSFAAALFTPLWMLRHRMWLVLMGYVVAGGALAIVLRLADASGEVGLTAGVLLALLVGFEAGTLRRFTLGRRRYRNVGVVVGDDLELAERRFFDAWVDRAMAPQPAAGTSSPVPAMPLATSYVIGLFPEPGGPR